MSRAEEGGIPAVSERRILSTDLNSVGQPIVFPCKDGHVTATLYEIQPGVTLPVHKHPFPRMGYVLEGELSVTVTGSAGSQTFGPGSLILEAVDRWHQGANLGRVPVRLLVIDLTQTGASDNTEKR